MREIINVVVCLRKKRRGVEKNGWMPSLIYFNLYFLSIFLLNISSSFSSFYLSSKYIINVKFIEKLSLML